MKYRMLITALFGLNLGLQASTPRPFVTVFENKTDPKITVNVELRFSDNSVVHKTLPCPPIVNFPDKVLTSVNLSSLDKDKNGNLYGSINQTFTTPKANAFYEVGLLAPEDVTQTGLDGKPFTYTVQKIRCTLKQNVDLPKKEDVKNKLMALKKNLKK